MLSTPPKPPELAGRLACAAAARVELDLVPIRQQVAERRGRSTGRRDFIEIERHAWEALDATWGDALGEACAEALRKLERFHRQEADHVAEAVRELERHGREAWIATAITADLANGLAFDVLEDLGELMELE